MQKKTIFLILLSLAICSSFILINFEEENKIIETEESPIEKIPLYYDLDNPNKIYTRDSNNNFVEVELNG